jgi:hypothetical protein
MMILVEMGAILDRRIAFRGLGFILVLFAVILQDVYNLDTGGELEHAQRTGSQQCLLQANSSLHKYWLDHNYAVFDPCEIAGCSGSGANNDNAQFNKVVNHFEKYHTRGSNINPDGLIRLPLHSIPLKYTMMSAFNQSIMNSGNARDPSYLALLDKMVYRKQCITVIVIGGSISCGGTRNHKRLNGPKSLKDAYPNKLEALLNAQFSGCSHPRLKQHVVDNRCHGGSGTGHFVDAVSAWKYDPSHYDTVGSADLIIVETAVNDYEFPNQIRAAAELLLRVLQEVKSREKSDIGPALLYLGVSTVSREPWRARGDSVLDQLFVTKAYGVPHLGVMDAFLPMRSRLEQYWFNDIYKGDDKTHLSTCGHGIVAGYLISFLQLLVCRSEHIVTAAMHHSIAGITMRMRPPSGTLFANAEQVSLFTLKAPYQVTFYDRKKENKGICKGFGFSIAADAPNKLGLIGHNMRNWVSIILPSRRNSSNEAYEMLKVEYLSSYVGMGTMNLTLTACDNSCSGVGTNDTAKVIASATVDCWDRTTKFSISRSVRLDFAEQVYTRCRSNRRKLASDPTDPSSVIQQQLDMFSRRQVEGDHGEVSVSNCFLSESPCSNLKLTIEIIPGAIPRSVNKIKLLSVSLY